MNPLWVWRLQLHRHQWTWWPRHIRADTGRRMRECTICLKRQAMP